jgi:hypothetical protein
MPSKSMYVVADSISKKHISYTCPICYYRYNKNGTPRKNSKHLIHLHGSENDLSNRIEHRNPPYHTTDLYIKINDATKRV